MLGCPVKFCSHSFDEKSNTVALTVNARRDHHVSINFDNLFQPSEKKYQAVVSSPTPEALINFIAKRLAWMPRMGIIKHLACESVFDERQEDRVLGLSISYAKKHNLTGERVIDFVDFVKAQMNQAKYIQKAVINGLRQQKTDPRRLQALDLCMKGHKESVREEIKGITEDVYQQLLLKLQEH